MTFRERAKLSMENLKDQQPVTYEVAKAQADHIAKRMEQGEDTAINTIIDQHVKTVRGYKYICVGDLPQRWHFSIREFMNSDLGGETNIDVPEEGIYHDQCYNPIQVIRWLKHSGLWRHT